MGQKREAKWWTGIFGSSPRPKQTVSLVGAGGKTTLLFTLAKELAGNGFRVSVTTTTHIFFPEKSQCRTVVTDGGPEAIERALAGERLVTVGVPAEEGKLTGPGDGMLRYLREASDFLLIEADGSRRLPVKVPREGEPALYEGTGLIVALGGLSCLGEPLGRVCHRAELAGRILGVGDEHRLTPDDLARLLYKSYGDCADVFVLNQADDARSQRKAAEAAGCLIGLGARRVAVTSFKTGRIAPLPLSLSQA